MGNNIRSSSSPKALAPSIPMPPLADAMDAVHLSVDRFCLLAGVEALAEMMEEDATTVCGARHRRHGDRRGYRWGRTHSEIGYHGGKVKVARPRVRDRAGKEVSLESWQALRDGNLLLEWALNLMVLNVSTRKYHRAVRLPEGDLAKARGDGTSKSAVSRRFVALSRKKMKAWLASDLSELDLLVIQIDGLHVGDHVLMAAIGVDGNGDKHVLAVVEGATENTVVVQALIDNLLARGLDPTLPRLFIVDGAKALSKAIRNTFGVAAAIQRCQVHKGRNIIERLPLHLHASVKKALRQAWDQDDADKAERLLRNLARRLEHEEPGVSGSILEGLDEILTVIRLGLPHELRRSLACTNIIENALGTVRQVTRNVKRWRNAEMALRWTAAGLLEAQKTFRRLKAYRQLPILRNALQELCLLFIPSGAETLAFGAASQNRPLPVFRLDFRRQQSVTVTGCGDGQIPPHSLQALPARSRTSVWPGSGRWKHPQAADACQLKGTSPPPTVDGVSVCSLSAALTQEYDTAFKDGGTAVSRKRDWTLNRVSTRHQIVSTTRSRSYTCR